MTTTAMDVTAQEPLTHREAMSLQATELERTLSLLQSLDEADWTTQTECPDWNVHQMYLHVLGACEAGASLKENAHQMMAAMKDRKANGGPLEAALSSVQVQNRADLSTDDLTERFTSVIPRTIRGRTRMPALMRRMKMKIDGPVTEKWRLGYLVDTIYLRDLWMHRVDAARVTGRDLTLSADHDGRIVNDVVAEWASRHGQPFTLTLLGPAGGNFTSTGSNSEAKESELIELDAVEFCRTLAGRAESTGLLQTIVPF